MGQQINVKSRSEGEKEDMPENFTLYAEKSPRKKKFVTHLDDYPKFIKLVKSPVHGRRREALLKQPLPPNLIPHPMSMSYPSSGSYHLIQPQLRFSNQQSPKVAYVDWGPQHRISNYNSYPNPDPRSNLFKSYSYDGYAQNLSHIPLVRRNSQYFIASSPQGYLANDRNFYSRNTHDDRVLVGNRGGINSGRRFGTSQENSAATSHQSAESSRRSTESGSEFYYPKEMDVETVERFRDENGRLVRLVKPIGSSTRIFNKANAPQMFMIVDQPNDYVTHSSPGRFVSDEREILPGRFVSDEREILPGRFVSDEREIDRISNGSFNSEENSIRKSNNSEENRSRGRSNNSEEYRRSRRSNYSEERENIPEGDERHEEEKEAEENNGIEEEEEEKDETEKEEEKEEEKPKKEEEEKPKVEENEEVKPKEEKEEENTKENSPKARKESKRIKEEKRVSLKEKKDKSEPEFKRENKVSYKDNIGMAKEVNVS